MKSQIHEKLTNEEIKLFEVLMSKKTNYKKRIRINIQYLIAAIIFLFLDFYSNEALYSIGIIIILILVLFLPLFKGSGLINQMHGLVVKYENEIKNLKKK